ncbi:hypothetical protein T492DRAFT_1125318 [Pavlovales sp. CCMP2436]|nr:hypothetical protein T492DRAFT_1125318 [Pavlovales sp. CCMP2436]
MFVWSSEDERQLHDQLREVQWARWVYRFWFTVIPLTLGIACGLMGALLRLLSARVSRTVAALCLLYVAIPLTLVSAPANDARPLRGLLLLYVVVLVLSAYGNLGTARHIHSTLIDTPVCGMRYHLSIRLHLYAITCVTYLLASAVLLSRLAQHAASRARLGWLRPFSNRPCPIDVKYFGRSLPGDCTMNTDSRLKALSPPHTPIRTRSGSYWYIFLEKHGLAPEGAKPAPYPPQPLTHLAAGAARTALPPVQSPSSPNQARGGPDSHLAEVKGARQSGSHRNGGARGCRGQALQHYSCTPLLCFRSMRAPGGVYEVADSSAGVVVMRSREGGWGPQVRVRALTRLRVSARSPPRSAARWARARPARLRRAIGGRGGRGRRWLAADVQRAVADIARAVEVALEDDAAARTAQQVGQMLLLVLVVMFCISARVCALVHARLAARGHGVSAATGVAALIGNVDPLVAIAEGRRRLKSVSCALLEADVFTSPVPSERWTCKAVHAELDSIDAFVSHSWHDDPVAKWVAFQEWRAEFIEGNCRESLVWIDRCCILVENGDLASFPIFLSGCRKLLIIAGLTFLNRLWCVVELFAFEQMHPFDFETASDATLSLHVELRPLPGCDLAGFEHYSVADAVCFVPHDGDRLQACIEISCGSIENFNARTRQLRLRKLWVCENFSPAAARRCSPGARGARTGLVWGRRVFESDAARPRQAPRRGPRQGRRPAPEWPAEGAFKTLVSAGNCSCGGGDIWSVFYRLYQQALCVYHPAVRIFLPQSVRSGTRGTRALSAIAASEMCAKEGGQLAAPRSASEVRRLSCVVGSDLYGVWIGVDPSARDVGEHLVGSVVTEAQSGQRATEMYG